VAEIQTYLESLNSDPSITGIIIQKPWTKKWLESVPNGDFAKWWLSLVSHIATQKSHGLNKDVDGLSPDTLVAIERGFGCKSKWYYQLPLGQFYRFSKIIVLT
jgi:hypothetical protein